MMDVKFRTNVNDVFLQRATDEVYKLLIDRNYQFSERWFNSFFVKKLVPILRYIGLYASLFGIALAGFLMAKPAVCPRWLSPVFILLFFILATMLFCFLPKLEYAIQKWSRRFAAKGCRKYAITMMKQAVSLAPFIAEYEIKDGSITYYRGKDDNWSKAWGRKLEGVAFQGETQTVLFKKATSLYPSILILHNDSKTMKGALESLDISIESIPQKIAEGYS